MSLRKSSSAVGRLWHLVQVLLIAAAFTSGLFLILPLIQAITATPQADTVLQQVDAAEIEPPPPADEEPEPEDEEPEEAPPELAEESEPLDLAQMDLALGVVGGGSGWMGGDFGVKLTSLTAQKDDVDSLFSLSDLDRKPRPIYTVSPQVNAAIRKKAPGTVYVIFIVDESGRVLNPKVQKSSDPVFEQSALAAIKKWKFEPIKRGGKAVRFRMRQPITFPEGI